MYYECFLGLGLALGLGCSFGLHASSAANHSVHDQDQDHSLQDQDQVQDRFFGLRPVLS